MRGLARVGVEIAVRTSALYLSFVVASAVLARIGKASLGAHQIAFQLYNLLALVLDALAIAGQVMVGRMLGAGDGDGAYAAARRLTVLSIAGGVVTALVLAALYGPLPHVFTSDPRVIDRLHAIWPLFAAMQPAAAAVFALDGVLIGAGDTRYLAFAMVAASLVLLRADRAARAALPLGHRRRLGRPARADRHPPARQRCALPAPPLDRARHGVTAPSPPRAPSNRGTGCAGAAGRRAQRAVRSRRLFPAVLDRVSPRASQDGDSTPRASADGTRPIASISGTRLAVKRGAAR